MEAKYHFEHIKIKTFLFYIVVARATFKLLRMG